jgi:hypothetical protein
MDFEELRAHLYGLLEFPADLGVENERDRNGIPIFSLTAARPMTSAWRSASWTWELPAEGLGFE